MRRFDKLLGALAAATIAAPLTAQQPPAMVSAANPEGIVELLRFAGYGAELGTDDFGDPQIDTEFGGLFGVVMFYGCDEETHRRCASVQLRVGLDRAEPMTVEFLHDEFGNDRFYAVHLDEEGDPWFNWDIVTGTGEGIPAPVFLLALNEFSTQVEAASDVVFAEERAMEAASAAPDE